MKQQIINILKQHPEGLKANDIARMLGTSKSEVNSVLYNSEFKSTLRLDKATYIWHYSSTPKQDEFETTAIYTQDADPKLRNLCLYYLECILREGHNQISVWQNSDYNSYEYIEADNFYEANTNSDVISFLRNISKDFVAHIGYPTMRISIPGKDGKRHGRLLPIFINRITYENGQFDIDPCLSINIAAINRYSGNNPTKISQETLSEYLSLETELGLNNPENEIDIEDLVDHLTHIREWEWTEVMDLSKIDTSNPINEITTDGIYNRCIITKTKKTNRFTEGLESELTALSNMSESSYKGTALYDWIHGFDEKQEPPTDNKTILEVLPLNLEQNSAVQHALSAPLTTISGPPGTGKSQVVSDLIINLAFNKKNALFSSRNNKAVDVVDIRVNSLGSKPIMLRMRNKNNYEDLLPFLNKLIESKPISTTEQKDFERLTLKYNTISQKINQLKKEQEHYVSIRNEVDYLSRDIEDFRHNWEHVFDILNDDFITNFNQKLLFLEKAIDFSDKRKQGFVIRILWPFVKSKRAKLVNLAKENLLSHLIQLKSDSNFDSLDLSNLICESNGIIDQIAPIVEYKNRLSTLNNSRGLEAIDKDLMKLTLDLQSNAEEMWNLWTKINFPQINPKLKEEILDLINSIILGSSNQFSEYDNTANNEPEESPDKKVYPNNVQAKIRRLLPICAVTSLSAKGRIPFKPKIYDLLIIDEASQCDIASILPLLYRAKRAAIIGDENQLKHISQISPKEDELILEKYNINKRFSYSATSLFKFASTINHRTIHLKDHHRSHESIINFSNKEFYDGELRVATKYDRLKSPRPNELGLRWIHTPGSCVRPASGSAFNKSEIEATIKELKRLVYECKYNGSIGFVTPFKKQAELLISELTEKHPDLFTKLTQRNSFLADTAHKFQGDEKDVMIFSLVISNDAKTQTLKFLKEQKNIFNVAITRARASLVVIGNLDYCLTLPPELGIDYIKNFAKYAKTKPPKPGTGPTPPIPTSEWEFILRDALNNAGIVTEQQHRVEKYFIDLALFLDDRKLAIEVDGERFHKDWDNELTYRDLLKNHRLFELGWDVRRFWVYQIRDNMPWCIEQIKKWIDNPQYERQPSNHHHM